MNVSSPFPLVEYDQASPEVQAIYDDTMELMNVPFVLNWFKCQGKTPHLLKGNWEKLKTSLLMGKVPILLKQLVLYNVSNARNCNYCAFVHKVTADSMSGELNDDPGYKVTDDLDSPYLPSSYKTALRIVTRLALQPQSINPQDFEDLYAEGYSPDEIQELFAQADLVNMLNTVADISGIPVDQQLLQAT